MSLSNVALIKQFVISAPVAVESLFINAFKNNTVLVVKVKMIFSEYDSYVVASPKVIKYLVFIDTILKPEPVDDNPYNTLLSDPFPTLDVAERVQPNDIDHTPGGISIKLVPVLTTFVFINGIDVVERIFIVDPIANLVSPVDRLVTTSLFVVKI
jgi:hypothetical protein